MREVVVTGGGTGIGYAIAAAFAKEGERVTITGRREGVLAEAAAALGVAHLAFDAADPAAVEQALAGLPERVDVLVNNAGGNTDLGAPPRRPGDLVALAESWRTMLAANLLSAVLVTAALAPRLADHARVVTIGSIAGRRGAGAYGAAKAAVEAWASSVAAELGPRGITANVVAPGLVTGTGFFGGQLSEQRRERLVAETSTGRAGTPEDIAAAVRFLCATGAGHVTGQVVHVNGGAYQAR